MAKKTADISKVMQLIYHSLRRMNEPVIHDVTMGDDDEVVLTLDNGTDQYQVFVISEDVIRETEPVIKAPSESESSRRKPSFGTLAGKIDTPDDSLLF